MGNSSGRRLLVPTKLGVALIHGFQLVDPELVVPNMRKNMESACSLIATGNVKKDEVLKHVLTSFKEKFRFFKNKAEEYMVQPLERIYQQVKQQQQDESLGIVGSTNGAQTGGLGTGNSGGGGGGKGSGGGKKGKGGNTNNAEEQLELKRLGLIKDKDKGGKGGDKGGDKGDKGSGKGKGKKGKKKGGDRDDDDWLDAAQMVHIMSTNSQQPVAGLGVTVSSAKEKEIKKIEKSLRQIELLEKEKEGGKTLDKTQIVKIEKKEELRAEMRRLAGN